MKISNSDQLLVKIFIPDIEHSRSGEYVLLVIKPIYVTKYLEQ